MPLWNPYDVSADIAIHAALPNVHHTPRAIATGSYAGNDAASRQIATGFKCSLVIIAVLSGYKNHAFIFTDVVYGHGPMTGYHDAIDSSLHATDGFVVTNTNYAMFNNENMNKSTRTFYWIAIEE